MPTRPLLRLPAPDPVALPQARRRGQDSLSFRGRQRDKFGPLFTRLRCLTDRTARWSYGMIQAALRLNVSSFLRLRERSQFPEGGGPHQRPGIHGGIRRNFVRTRTSRSQDTRKDKRRTGPNGQARTRSLLSGDAGCARLEGIVEPLGKMGTGRAVGQRLCAVCASV